MRLDRRFARLVTDVAVRAPWAWPLLRRPLRRMFDAIAPRWDDVAGPDRLGAFEAALDVVEAAGVAPRRVLDLGTGTGDGALALARRWPEADVTGVDVSAAMVAEARAKTPPELGGRVRFAVADARRLPVGDGAADLVAMNNAIPFFAELGRVVAPGGHVVLAFSEGPGTPIYVAPARLRAGLERHGFEVVAEVAPGPGTAVVARRTAPR